MSESTALLLAVTVGLPMALLALAVIHHARVIGRMPAADEGWDPEESDELPEVFSLPAMTPTALTPDPMIADLQRTVTELQGQLARQRDTLTGLLSDQQRAARATATATALATAMTRDASNESPALEVADLGSAVRDLSAEGLSERAIARRLHVGLEEVRLLSRRQELAS